MVRERNIDSKCVYAALSIVGVKVGDLRAAIKFLTQQEKDTRIKDMVVDTLSGGTKAALKMLIGLFPGGGTVTGVIDLLSDVTNNDPISNIVGGLFKKFKNTPDSKSSKNPVMKAMDLDDDYMEILDDNLLEKFVKEKMKELENLGDSEELPDMNEELEEYVVGKYDSGIFKP